jgi:chromosome partitioning protein
MTIVTVGGIKGGSGKTTVATNLACIAAGQGADVLLVDADNQETAFDFTNARKADNPGAPSYTCVKLTGSSVRTEVLAMAKKYDHVVIDAGGRDTTSQRAALSVSNALLIPCKPRSFDLWAIENVAQLVDEASTINPTLQAFVFLNQTDPAGQGSENQDTIEELKKFPGLSYLDAPLGSRKAFAHAASLGLAVTELTRPHHNPKAVAEIMALFQGCFKVTMTSRQRQAARA